MGRKALGNSGSSRITMCRAVTGKNYEWPGTADFGIHDPKSGTVLTFSVVNMGGQWNQLQIYPAVKLKELNSMLGLEAVSISEIFQFQKSLASWEVGLACFHIPPKEVSVVIDTDEYVERLSEEDRHMIATAIDEVFA